MPPDLIRYETNTGLRPKNCGHTDVDHTDSNGAITAMLRRTTGGYSIIVVAEGAYANWSRADLLAEGELMLTSKISA